MIENAAAFLPVAKTGLNCKDDDFARTQEPNQKKGRPQGPKALTDVQVVDSAQRWSFSTSNARPVHRPKP